MSYLIDARLECGLPALTMIDAETGEERLRWHCDNTVSAERDLRALFKRLVLLSCADQISLVQRAKSSGFGGECIDCQECEESAQLLRNNQSLMFLWQKKIRPQI